MSQSNGTNGKQRYNTRQNDHKCIMFVFFAWYEFFELIFLPRAYRVLEYLINVPGTLIEIHTFCKKYVLVLFSAKPGGEFKFQCYTTDPSVLASLKYKDSKGPCQYNIIGSDFSIIWIHDNNNNIIHCMTKWVLLKLLFTYLIQIPINLMMCLVSVWQLFRFFPNLTDCQKTFKPEFTIVIFINYKTRVAVAILDL